MLPNQMVAPRVEEDGEAPGVAEGDEMRFAGVVFDVEGGELCDLLAGDGRSVYPFSEGGMEHYNNTPTSAHTLAEYGSWLGLTNMKSTPNTPSCTSASGNPP